MYYLLVSYYVKLKMGLRNSDVANSPALYHWISLKSWPLISSTVVYFVLDNWVIRNNIFSRKCSGKSYSIQLTLVRHCQLSLLLIATKIASILMSLKEIRCAVMISTKVYSVYFTLGFC